MFSQQKKKMEQSILKIDEQKYSVRSKDVQHILHETEEKFNKILESPDVLNQQINENRILLNNFQNKIAIKTEELNLLEKELVELEHREEELRDLKNISEDGGHLLWIFNFI